VLGSYGFVKNITTSTIIGSDQGNVHWRYNDIWLDRLRSLPFTVCAAWSYQGLLERGKCTT
jgi:hypothetical protein